MLDIRIAIYQFKNPDVFVLDKKDASRPARFVGILGDYYQQLFDAMRWNVTYLDRADLKRTGKFNASEFDNEDVLAVDLVDKNMADFYFRAIPLVGDFVSTANIRMSPAVSYSQTRLIQCVHRKDDYNTRDVLYGLQDLEFNFWLKLASIFVCLWALLAGVYFVRNYHRQTLYRQLAYLLAFLFLLIVRIFTRQNTDRRTYRNLHFIIYFVLLVLLLVPLVLHQLLFYVAFVDLKFRNTTYILRDLKQVLADPGLVPCFLESETLIDKKVKDPNSTMYKLYYHRKDVCFLGRMIAANKGKTARSHDTNNMASLFKSILIGTSDYVEYFAFLFCGRYSEFIRTMLKQMLGNELNPDLPLFWYPSFEDEQTLEAFFISAQASHAVQSAIYDRFVYRILEHGYVWLLKYAKHKMDNHPLNECFTSDFRRIYYPYRFQELIIQNFYAVFGFLYTFYAAFGGLFILNWIFRFFNQHIQLNWIKSEI